MPSVSGGSHGPSVILTRGWRPVTLGASQLAPGPPVSLLRRSSIFALASIFGVSILCASVAAASGTATTAAAASSATAVDVAEQRVVGLINQRRDQKGLRALQLDPRVAAVARARSQDMIDRHYFSHRDPDGKFARQHLEHARIRFTRASEIIAWDQGTDLQAAAADIVRMWMGDSVHRHEVMSTTHNYLGAGVATDGHTVMWTVISITGPDRTDPTTRITSIALNAGEATLSWHGHDPRLVVGTAGVHDYDLARRDPGGAWTMVLNDTRSVSATVAANEGTEFRVRARDNAGNVGPWSVPATATSVPT